MRQARSDDSLRCSFCHKPQGTVGKLISSPSEYPRAYICDECIAVCHAILEDDRASCQESSPIARERSFDPALVPELVDAVERWSGREREEQDASQELDEIRRIATLMYASPAEK